MGKRQSEDARVIPLFGKDEMNLIEFPFGPVTSTTAKTLEVEHRVWDGRLRREVFRRMIITGADKFGLPRPVDDQVLLGMKTLTHEAGFESPKVTFSRYELCRIIGWVPDGRCYARLEESFDRIAGTTLKFKDGWYDNGEKAYKSKTFHLITEVDLCSRDQLARSRLANGRVSQKLCSFIWTDVIWKSFQDGFIKTLDMAMYRKIAQGRRREVPLRLFRILDKRFYHSRLTKFDLRRLCIGTLGLCATYSPSQMMRVLDRAGQCLIDCEYLAEMWYRREGNSFLVHFRKRAEQRQTRSSSQDVAMAPRGRSVRADSKEQGEDALKLWLSAVGEEELARREEAALESLFGSELERRIVLSGKAKGIGVLEGGRIRQEYLRRFTESDQVTKRKLA